MADRPSVTQLTGSLTSSGPLPPDLNAALNLAVYYAGSVDTILSIARITPSTAEPWGQNLRQAVVNSIEGMRAEYPHQGVLRPVSNELTAVSDPANRFGAASAHQAAIELGRRVLALVWRTADPVRWARCHIDPDERMDVRAVEERFPEVCEALAAEQWPDPNAITVACQIEAARAAQARGWLRPAGGDAGARLGADVPPQQSEPAAPGPVDLVAEADSLIARFVRVNEAVLNSPVRLVAISAGNVDARAALASPSLQPPTADVVVPQVEGVRHVEYMGIAGVEQDGRVDNVFLHALAGGHEPEPALRRFCDLAAEAGRLYQRLPSDRFPQGGTTSPRNLWVAILYGWMRLTEWVGHHDAQDYDFISQPFVASAELLKRFRETLVAPTTGNATPPAPQVATGTPVGVRSNGKGKNVEARMLKKMSDDRDSLGWSASQWAEFLDCSAGTVKETRVWKEQLKAVRAMQAVDAAKRMDTSRRTPKGRRGKPK